MGFGGVRTKVGTVGDWTRREAADGKSGIDSACCNNLFFGDWFPMVSPVIFSRAGEEVNPFFQRN